MNAKNDQRMDRGIWVASYGCRSKAFITNYAKYTRATVNTETRQPYWVSHMPNMASSSEYRCHCISLEWAGQKEKKYWNMKIILGMSASPQWLSYICMNCPFGAAYSKYSLPNFLSLLISWKNNLHWLTLELTISQKKNITIVVHKAGFFFFFPASGCYVLV